MYDCRVIEDNNIRLRIVVDEYPECPRKWDNIGTMVCWHRRYDLGDSHNYNSPEEFLVSIIHSIMDNSLMKKIIAETKNGKYKNTRLQYYRSSREWVLESYYVGFKKWYAKYSFSAPIKYDDNVLVDYILDSIGVDDLLSIASVGYIILPLYLYDHSGITMNTTGFSCPWDSGQVGWIYCSKDRFREETGYSESELFSTDIHRMPKIGEKVKITSKPNFGEVVEIKGDCITIDFDYNKALSYKNPDNKIKLKKSEIIEVLSNRALNMLIDEVKTYDDYLTGNVYGFILEEKETCEECGDEEYTEIFSLWGFYGDDFINNGLFSEIPKEYRHLIDKVA